MDGCLEIFNFILKHKKIFCAILVLIIVRFFKIIFEKENNTEDCLKFENLSPKKQKLFLLTQFNTSLNRNEPKEREKFIKQVYEEIYGKNGFYIYEKLSKPAKNKNKKKVSVKFSGKVEFSRN
jgi:predicted NUDIX family phosphoesterase